MKNKDLLELRMALDTCSTRVVYKGVEMTLFDLLENLKFNYGEKTMLKAYEVLANTNVENLDIDKEIEKIINLKGEEVTKGEK